MKLPHLFIILLVFALGSTMGYIIGKNKTDNNLQATRPAPPKTLQSLSDLEDSHDSPNTPSTSGTTQTDAIDAFDQISDTAFNSLITEISDDLARNVLTPNEFNQLKEKLNQLAKTAPLQALEFAKQIQSPRLQQETTTNILRIWATENPLAAISWADSELQNDPTHLKRAKLRAIFGGYAEKNPSAAFALAESLPYESSAERRIKTSILREIIETEVEQGSVHNAKLRIDNLAEGPLKDGLVRELVDEWASYDPVSAAAYVDALGDQANPYVKTSLVDEWAEINPQAAADWLSTLAPEDPAFASGARRIIREWSRYDLNASAQWLNSLPASQSLDRAVISYTQQAALEDPEMAMSWAESITNDKMRQRTINSVIKSWEQTDADALKRYLEANEKQ